MISRWLQIAAQSMVMITAIRSTALCISKARSDVVQKSAYNSYKKVNKTCILA